MNRDDTIALHLILLAAGNSRRFGTNKLLYPLEGKPLYLHTLDKLRSAALRFLKGEIPSADSCLWDKLEGTDSSSAEGSAISGGKDADGQYPFSNVSIHLYVVTQHEEILRQLAFPENNRDVLPASIEKRFSFQPVFSPDSQKGISYSIRTGITAACRQDECSRDRFLFLVADQPYLKESTLLSFLYAAAFSSKSTGCVCFGEHTGNPVYFDRIHLPDLLSLKGDKGGKSILKKYPGSCLFFPVTEALELADADTPDFFGD